MTSLTVVCPGGRRQVVATTPNMTLLQVMEAACAKRQMDPSGCTLKHGRQTLDLTHPVRLCGRQNHAVLELVVGE